MAQFPVPLGSLVLQQIVEIHFSDMPQYTEFILMVLHDYIQFSMRMNALVLCDLQELFVDITSAAAFERALDPESYLPLSRIWNTFEGTILSNVDAARLVISGANRVRLRRDTRKMLSCVCACFVVCPALSILKLVDLLRLLSSCWKLTRTAMTLYTLHGLELAQRRHIHRSRAMYSLLIPEGDANEIVKRVGRIINFRMS